MKIVIVGAGAMGSLFGALLSAAGNAVSLLDPWAAHVAAIAAAGVGIEREGRCRFVPVHAATDPESIASPAELVIVFVKSTHTRAAAPTAAALAGERGRVLTLQNGLGNAETLASAVGGDRVIAGTTAHGATLLAPGRVRHAGVGPTTLGMWTGGRPAGLERIAVVFEAAGIDVAVADEIRPVIWDKLLVNVGINAVTALTAITNGQLLDLPATREIARAAVEEAMAVAAALDIPVRGDAVDHVFAVARATAANRSSMGQDVDHRRPTEIAAINGAVVRRAAALGVPAPVNRTLTALIETLQAHYGNEGAPGRPPTTPEGPRPRGEGRNHR